MTREQVIEKLVDNDFDDIKQGFETGDGSYLRDILVTGMKGYDNFSNKELEEEYDSQDFEPFNSDNIKCKII